MLTDDTAAQSTEPSSIDTANVLTRGLSQATSNVIHSLLGVNNRSSISFVPPIRGGSDISLQSSDGLPHTKQQQSAYQLNDLLANFYNSDNPVDSTQNVIQSDSEAGPYIQEEPTFTLDDTYWTTSEMWDSSSFDFDEPSIDF